MSEDLFIKILNRLASQPKGREGTLSELVGDRLWARVPAPSRDARIISEYATNLSFLHKNNRNHRVYRVV
jgi:hypothetical protein